MTAQVLDSVLYNGHRYALCGVRGEGLFDAARLGIETAAPNTACWRGWVCGYGLQREHLVLERIQLWSDAIHWARNRQLLERFFGDLLPLDDQRPGLDARDLAFPILFTGGLLLGEDPVGELPDIARFHPACRFRTVLELTFESGLLLASADRSAEMAAVRDRDARRDRERSSDLGAWMDDSLRLDY